MAWNTQSVRVRTALAEAIANGHHEPGERLILRKVADSMGVSMIPVRDALAQLEKDGLVEGMAGRGWRVPDFDAERIAEMGELREALECQIVRLCALRGSDDEFEELMLLGKQLDRLPVGEERDKLEARFHTRLAEIARNDLLLESLTRTRVLQHAFGHKMTRKPPPNHQRLAADIASRNPEQAEAEMRRHVKLGTRLLTAGLKAKKQSR